MQRKKGSSATINFMLLFIGFYIAQIIYFGLLPSMLADFGYGETFVGYVMTLMSATGLVVRLLLGYIVDKYSCPKGIVTVVFSFYALMQVLFFYLYTSSLYITIFALTAMGFVGVVGGICDSWAVKYQQIDSNLDYGMVRSFGSISYAITGLVSGQLIAKYGNGVAAFMALIAWLIVMFAAIRIPNPPRVETKAEKVSFSAGLKECLKSKPFVLMLVCSLLCMPAETSANSYYSLIVTTKGGDAGDVGLGLFVMAFSEFWVIFFFSKLSKKFGADRLYYFGLFGDIIRCIVLALAPNATWVIIGICTQAISFGLTMPGSVICIKNHVGYKYSAIGLQLMYVIKGIMSMIINTPLGYIAENLGINTFLYVGTIPAILGAVLLMATTEKRLKKEKQAAIAA